MTQKQIIRFLEEKHKLLCDITKKNEIEFSKSGQLPEIFLILEGAKLEIVSILGVLKSNNKFPNLIGQLLEKN